MKKVQQIMCFATLMIFICTFTGTIFVKAEKTTQKQRNSTITSIKPPKIKWNIISDTSMTLFGHDPSNNNLLALGENNSHFFLFKEPSFIPLWIQKKRVEGYIREIGFDFFPFGQKQIAVLTRYVNQYRLLNISNGEPLTDFFTADYSEPSYWYFENQAYYPFSIFVDETSSEPRILAIYNGTARLMNSNLSIIWNCSLNENQSFPHCFIYYLNSSSATLQVLIFNSDTARFSNLNITDGSTIWQTDQVYPEYISNSIGLSDCNGDGIIDILCRFYNNNSGDWSKGLKVLNGLTGASLWQYQINMSYLLFSHCWCDLDGDGNKEIIFSE